MKKKRLGVGGTWSNNAGDNGRESTASATKGRLINDN